MTTREIIRHILSTEEKSRKDDNYLFARVIEETAKNNGTYNQTIGCFAKILCNGKFPVASTVIRERRYIQLKEPELTDRETVIKRCRSEAEYRERYRNGN